MFRKPFQLAPGRRIPGTKWDLVAEIARGGMGVTWSVVKEPGIRGVMKMILPELARSGAYVDRFLEEVAILAKLNHPHIVQVFDFDRLEDGTPFFVMEHLEGRTLGSALRPRKNGQRARKALPARIAYEITRQTCEALHRAHSLKPKAVIHRDVKPDNIFIHHPSFGEPVVKLLDFGVAAFEEPKRESGAVGTPRYMAPEQLRSEALTPRCDLYAMALVLYEMLCGRGPFDDLAAPGAERALVLANAHLNEVPPPPSKFAKWIPASVDALILSALDKDPSHRPDSAYALVTKLFELQFVNDGTPRPDVDINTTAPTLVKILEEEAASEPRVETHDTLRDDATPEISTDAPEDAHDEARGGTLRMTPSPDDAIAVAATQPAVDREARTRTARKQAPMPRSPTDTEPIGSALSLSPSPPSPSAKPVQDATVSGASRSVARPTRGWRRTGSSMRAVVIGGGLGLVTIAIAYGLLSHRASTPIGSAGSAPHTTPIEPPAPAPAPSPSASSARGSAVEAASSVPVSSARAVVNVRHVDSQPPAAPVRSATPAKPSATASPGATHEAPERSF